MLLPPPRKSSQSSLNHPIYSQGLARRPCRLSHGRISTVNARGFFGVRSHPMTKFVLCSFSVPARHRAAISVMPMKHLRCRNVFPKDKVQAKDTGWAPDQAWPEYHVQLSSARARTARRRSFRRTGLSSTTTTSRRSAFDDSLSTRCGKDYMKNGFYAATRPTKQVPAWFRRAAGHRGRHREGERRREAGHVDRRRRQGEQPEDDRPGERVLDRRHSLRIAQPRQPGGCRSSTSTKSTTISGPRSRCNSPSPSAVIPTTSTPVLRPRHRLLARTRTQKAVVYKSCNPKW